MKKKKDWQEELMETFEKADLEEKKKILHATEKALKFARICCLLVFWFMAITFFIASGEKMNFLRLIIILVFLTIPFIDFSGLYK